MQEDLMIDDGCGWAVAGILTELEGAILTTTVGDGGLAGTMELVGNLGIAANESSFGHAYEGEQG